MRDRDYIATIVELDPVVPEWLEKQLQRLFQDVSDEPLPDNLVRLLRRLEDEQHR